MPSMGEVMTPAGEHTFMAEQMRSKY